MPAATRVACLSRGDRFDDGRSAIAYCDDEQRHADDIDLAGRCERADSVSNEAPRQSETAPIRQDDEEGHGQPTVCTSEARPTAAANPPPPLRSRHGAPVLRKGREHVDSDAGVSNAHRCSTRAIQPALGASPHAADAAMN